MKITRYEFDERAQIDCGITYDLWRYQKPPKALEVMNPAAWEMARHLKAFPGVLYVFGPEGVGKSSLCRYLLGRAIKSGRKVQEVSAGDIETLWWRFEYEESLKRAAYSSVLLIDDVSNAPWTPRGLGILRSVLDKRHERQRCTLVTSNCSIQDLARTFARVSGDETYAVSLIRRMRPYSELSMTGESFRLTMQHQQQEVGS